MKYLSFDIECCDGKHMCEFGYVIADEQLNVLEKDVILMDPEHPFNLVGRPHQKDLFLYFSEDDYRRSPTFPTYYDRIKTLLENPEYKILGFALGNDVGFLGIACTNYGKDPITFSYVDFQKLYVAYSGATGGVSMECMLAELGLKEENLHKSDDDAMSVFRSLKAIAQKENSGIAETLKMLREKKGRYYAELAVTRRATVKEKAIGGSSKAQREYTNGYLKDLQKKFAPSENSKKVCVSAAFQKHSFNEFLALLECIYKSGDTYSAKASECSVFVRCDAAASEVPAEDARLISFQNAMNTDEERELVELDAYLGMLGTTRESLAQRDVLKLNKPRAERNTFSTGTGGSSTLGDLLLAKGVDLRKLFPDDDE